MSFHLDGLLIRRNWINRLLPGGPIYIQYNLKTLSSPPTEADGQKGKGSSLALYFLVAKLETTTNN